MRFYVGVTDNSWYDFLKKLQPDEVNFWKPSGGSFKAIQEGSPFLFKLHSPYNFIVGGGFFVKYRILPLSLAWQAFEYKNGAAEYQAFKDQIRKYREPRGTMQFDPKIGCIILAEPFFFNEDNWIPVPEDWKTGIIQGKTYDTQDSIGAILWDKVQALLQNFEQPFDDRSKLKLIVETRARYGNEYLVHPRLGQGAFRVLVTEAYNYRCAMTGERTLPVLQASHIKPYSQSGPHRVDNGLLLRADLHILFDKGYVTITDDYRIEVSPRIKEEYENGRDYYAMSGKQLTVLPNPDIEKPSIEFIEWHNQNIFVT